MAETNLKSLDGLIEAVIKGIGYDWGEVQKAVVNWRWPDERQHPLSPPGRPSSGMGRPAIEICDSADS